MLRKLATILFVGAMLGIIVLTGCKNPVAGISNGSNGSGGSSSSSGSSGTSGTSDTTAKTILASLGVNEVSNPPAATVETQTGTTMTIDPSTWQPLKTKYATFIPEAEIFQAGGSPGTPGSPSAYGTGSNWSSFYENGASLYSMTAPFIGGLDQKWEQTAAKVSVAADLTGKGVDDIVVFYVNQTALGTLNDIVYTPLWSGSTKGSFGSPQPVSGVSLNTTAKDTVDNQGAGTDAGIGTPWFPYFSCTKADLNGDGIDEILLADYDTLYELSVTESGAVSVVTHFQPWKGHPITSVAAGDYNGSGRDDVIVGLYPDHYILYDSHFDNNTATDGTGGTASGQVPSLTPTSPVEATFGNFDGNGLEELALCGQAADGGVLATMWDVSATGSMSEPTWFEEANNPFYASNYTAHFYRILPRAVDIKGTGTDALCVLGSIYMSPMIQPQEIGAGGAPTPDYRIGNADGKANTTAAPLYNNECTMVDIQVGLTGSSNLPAEMTTPQQDLVVLSEDRAAVPDIEVYGLDSSGDFQRLETILAPYDETAIQSYNLFGSSTCIAVGNFENNSPRVEYVGHTLTFTNPHVIAALASPPYWSNIVNSDSGYQNSYTGWNTTFGETQANSTDHTTKVGFSVGAEVKFEDDIDIFGLEAASFETSVGFKNTNTWEWDNSSTVEKDIMYNCVGGENLVIFTSVPMDQYQYKVDSSPDPADTPVGSFLYIVIPRTFSTYSVTQEFFNSHINTNVVQAISNSVFGTSNFKIGDPTTYPSYDLEQSIMNNAFATLGGSGVATNYQYGPTPAQQGSNNNPGGSTNLQITLTTGSAKTISHDFETEISAGGGAGGLSVLANAGFQTGYSTTYQISAATTFGGTIGYLPTNYYTDSSYDYSAGIFVYPYKQLNGNSFWVISYWVTQP